MKAFLKRLVWLINQPTVVPFSLLVLDLVDDGVVNLSYLPLGAV